MRFSGTGIITFDCFRFKSKPKTVPAIKWIQASDNNWKSIDRGASNDVYQSEVQFYGTETEIDNIIDNIEANRIGGINYFTLSQFNGVDDQLFGADIDYSSTLDTTIVKWGKRKQKQFKSYTWNVIFQLVENPYPYDGMPSLPILRPFIGYNADSTWTLNKIDTYDNTFTYIDHNKDSGIFEGTFIMSQTEMKTFRRYILSTIRGTDLIITDVAGIPELFGSKSSGYPITTRLLDFKDELLNINFWAVKVKLTEVV